MMRVSRLAWVTTVGWWLLAGYAVAQPQAKLRDVLADAFAYPFVTDAEVGIHFSNVHGQVSSPGGPALFRCPGIVGVQVDGVRAKAARVGEDLLRTDLAMGAHDIVILTQGEAAQSETLPANPEAVATLDALRSRAAQLQPGGELVVADGTYTNWQVDLKADGTAGKPILIRPQTPGGVTFRRNSRIGLTGQFVVLKGFRFEHCGPGVVVHLAGASDCRVTQCQFFHCGNPVSTFTHIVDVNMGSHRNRVDHCYFTGSKSMSLGQRVSAAEGVGTQNRFDHNIFRDVYCYWINGQENIQLGQNQRGATGWARAMATVEFNLFDHAWGDSEIISNKSSGNVIRHNLAAHCTYSAFTLRGGDDVRFEGNVMVSNAAGLRVMGKKHTIVNNLFLAHPQYGIILETGSADGQNQVATEGTLIADNTFIGCAEGAIGAMPTAEDRPFAPRRNTVENNLIVGTAGAFLDGRLFLESTVRRNLFWAGGEKIADNLGEEAVVADPLLVGEGWTVHPGPGSPAIDKALSLETVAKDRWNRFRPGGKGPDIGADEVDGAEPAERVVLPPVPPKPILAPDLYMGECVWQQDPTRPLDGWRAGQGAVAEKDALALTNAGAEPAVDLPGDFVMVWEHQPATFDAAASVTFAADAQGRGYVFAWGGVAKDGKPSGIIALRKLGSEDVVADSADTLCYYKDFRFERWLDKTRNTRTAPDPATPYRFTLLKKGGRLIVLLDAGCTWRAIPVLIWEDRGVVGGPAPQGTRLRIDQRGAGAWRGLKVWRHSYTGDKPPLVPKLTARSHGGHRVTLRWQASPDAQDGCRYDVHRDVKPGFTPSSANLIARRMGGGGYDDFDVAPQTSYSYAVRAYNPLGLPSEFARAEVATGEGGAIYQVIQATGAAVLPPMRLGTDETTSRRYLSAPGAERSQQAPPTEGCAEFHVSVPEPGKYAVWGLVFSPDAATDSFYVALDPAGGGKYREWGTGIHRLWAWSRALDSVTLDRGEHVIALKHREPATRLAALMFTTDPQFEPAGP